MLSASRAELLKWIDRDQDDLIAFLGRFVRAASPNPPGDTRRAVEVICDFLREAEVPYKIVDPEPTMPNVLGAWEGGRAGRHLVLNGHIDVYPVGDEPWSHEPWSGSVADGHMYGRGVCDMKAGTAASILTYAYLSRIKEELSGRLTLTAVSDEETMGPWGARYLMEHYPEIHGDCLLNGEPSSPYSIRVGEKGLLWLRFTVTTPGAHGSYTHRSKSATRIAASLIRDLDALHMRRPDPPPEAVEFLGTIEAATERSQGEGAFQTVQCITVNIGVVHGGLKVNMVPGRCVLEVDIRLPLGATRDSVMPEIVALLQGYPDVELEEVNYMPPSFCDPNGDMIKIIQRNVQDLQGFAPTPILSIGGTDARLWRYRGIPGYVYGVSPTGMASSDERVELDEWLHVVKTHLLSAYDYLRGE